MVHRSKRACTRSGRNITEFQRGRRALTQQPAFLPTPCPAWMRVPWAGCELPQEHTRGTHLGATALTVLCRSVSNRTWRAHSATLPLSSLVLIQWPNQSRKIIIKGIGEKKNPSWLFGVFLTSKGSGHIRVPSSVCPGWCFPSWQLCAVLFAKHPLYCSPWVGHS